MKSVCIVKGRYFNDSFAKELELKLLRTQNIIPKNISSKFSTEVEFQLEKTVKKNQFIHGKFLVRNRSEKLDKISVNIEMQSALRNLDTNRRMIVIRSGRISVEIPVKFGKSEFSLKFQIPSEDWVVRDWERCIVISNSVDSTVLRSPLFYLDTDQVY